MTKRIALTESAVGTEYYNKLQKVRSVATHPYIVEIFKDLKSRRKSYMLTDFKDFKPHATEYTFKDFFQVVSVLGINHTLPREEPKHIRFVKTLANLSTRLGHRCDYQDMMDILENSSDTHVREQKFVEVIPGMLFAYTTGTRPQDLTFKLEYFFGAEVIDILLVNNVKINTGRELTNPGKARVHATRSLAGLPIQDRHLAEFERANAIRISKENA